MTRLFANPLAGRPSAASCPHQHVPVLTSMTRANRVLVGTEREAKMRRWSPLISMSCREAATPVPQPAAALPTSRHAHATSMFNREQRLTDEAFRSQVAIQNRPTVRSGRSVSRVAPLGTPELCCGPLVGAAERLGSIPARNL